MEQSQKATFGYAPDTPYEPDNGSQSMDSTTVPKNAKRTIKLSYDSASQSALRMKGKLKETEVTTLAKQITPLNLVDPMTDDLSVQGRCISIWHSHRVNHEKDPYSLDLVLQDNENNRIQVFIKKELMYKFEPLFVEGQCYHVSNFGVAENGGKLPLLPHKFKIAVHKNTTVTRIDPINDNNNGFIFDDFGALWDINNPYNELDAVDVIGTVVAIGEIVPLNWAGVKKLRRTVVLQDNEENTLDCTFWDAWAERWNEYAENTEKIGHTVCILQLGKVKYWNGKPAVNNALFGSKLYINTDLPEIIAFRQSQQEHDTYDEKDYQIALFTPEKPVVTIESFFKGTIKTMVGSIRDSEPVWICKNTQKGSKSDVNPGTRDQESLS